MTQINVALLTDSTPLLNAGDGDALRARWADDGVLFFRDIIDHDVLHWAEGYYRKELVVEGLIDPDNERPVLTGTVKDTWRPCDRIGTIVWKKIIQDPKLNEVLRHIFEADPVFLPIAAHRSGYPSAPLTEGQRIFAGEHQDAFYNEGMNATICWMPVRDVIDMDSGTFALAPGTHKRGYLHDPKHPTYKIPEDAIPEDAWRSAVYKVGDVVFFRDDTAHAALPNLSDEIRLSFDIRLVSSKAPQVACGTVEALDGTAVTIRNDVDDELITVHVDDNTYIRDMNPQPRIPTAEVEKIAYVGARVLAMNGDDGMAKVLRRNRY